MYRSLLRRGASPIVVALSAAALLWLLMAGSAAAATITVNTTSEANAVDGACSLREAIQAANTNVAVNECPAGSASPTVDVIAFNIAPLDGTVKTIIITSELPIISESVTIDGFTQNGASVNTNPIASGSNAQLKIELQGSGSTSGAGLIINGGVVTVQGLVINGFSGAGIFVATATQVTIAGNYVGLDPTGASAQGNGLNGIEVANAPNATIGGTTAAARNVASGNTGAGIFLRGAASTNGVIQGNIVGLNAAGTVDLGNSLTGIVVSGTTGAQIGGTAAGSANVSSGNNTTGIQVEGGATGTVIQGNFVGTNAAGTAGIGNSQGGIGILAPSTGTVVGGIVAGEGNVIAHTTGSHGVRMEGGTGHTVRGNRIFSNAGRGIALGSGRAANDSQDPDTGINNLQNFPTLASAAVSGGSTRYSGALNSTPSRNFAIDVYRNTVCGDSGGSGEGETYVGSTTLATDASGDGTFSFSVSGGAAGQIYTATATDLTTGDTSEFSLCTTSVAPGVTVTQSGGTTAVAEGGASDSFTVQLTSQPSSDVTVTLSPNAQVTVSPTGPLTFTSSNWNTPQTVTVTAVDDAVAEGSHSGTVSFGVSSADPLYTGITVSDVTVTITDNDTVGITVTQSGGTTTVTEGGATDTFDVVLTSQPTADVTISLTPDSQVTTSPPGPLTFTTANWNVPQTVTVTAVDDAVAEGTHAGSVAFTVTSPDTAYNGQSVPSVSISITDNEVATLTIADAQVTEGDSGTSVLTFTVTLTQQSAQTVTVQYATSDATATAQATCSTAGADYQPASGTLTFAPTVTTQTFTVQVCGDTTVEPDETFQVTLSSPTNTTIGDGVAVGTIVNDDAGGTVQFAAASAQVSEADGALTVTVERASGVASGVTVQYATSNGTATAGQDYAATSGTLTFAVGETTKTFSVPILANAVDEPSEVFTIALTNPTGGATLGSPATQTVTIADRDVTPCRTTLAADVPIGSTTLPVVSQSGCQINDHIAINRGGSTEERAIISGFGSIIIDQPTQRAHRAGESVVKIDVGEDLGRAVVPPKDDSDKPVKETEEERQQRERTNRGNKDDVFIEGDVLEVHQDEQLPYVVIANRDGRVKVVLLCRNACPTIRVGDYLEADGEKQHEQLFEATEVTVRRRR